MQYIDRDPETIRKQEALRAKEKMDMDDEERTSQFIQKQIERAAETAKQVSTEYTELQRVDDDEKGDNCYRLNYVLQKKIIISWMSIFIVEKR